MKNKNSSSGKNLAHLLRDLEIAEFRAALAQIGADLIRKEVGRENVHIVAGARLDLAPSHVVMGWADFMVENSALTIAGILRHMQNANHRPVAWQDLAKFLEDSVATDHQPGF